MNPTMPRSWIIRIASVCAVALAVQACRPNPPEPPPPPKPAYTKEFLKSVLQNLSLEPLGPAGTAVDVLANSPEATKVFLKAWSDSEYIKAVDMEQRTEGREKAQWEEKIQWYDAVSGCVGSSDCRDLRRLQEAKNRPRTHSNPPPPPPPPRQFGGEAGADAGDADGQP